MSYKIYKYHIQVIEENINFLNEDSLIRVDILIHAMILISIKVRNIDHKEFN